MLILPSGHIIQSTLLGLHIVLRTASILHGIRSKKKKIYYSENLVCITTVTTADLSAARPWCKSLCHPPQRCPVGLSNTVALKSPDSEPSHLYTWCKWKDVVSSNTQVYEMPKWCSACTQGLRNHRNYHYSSRSSSLGGWHKAGRIQAFMLFTPNSDLASDAAGLLWNQKL